MACLKLALDVIMAGVFVLLLNRRVLGGLVFHEIAGLAIMAAFLTHTLFSWKWVVGVSRRFLTPKLPIRTRLVYVLNWLLLLAMIFIIVSGILVSRVVFPGIHVANKRFFAGAHISVSFLVLATVGVHVGLHWNWLASAVRRGVRAVAPFAQNWRVPSVIVVPALLLFGAYESYNTRYAAKVGLIRNILRVQERGPDFRGRDGERRVEQRREDRGRESFRSREGMGGGRRGAGRRLSASAWEVVFSYLGVMGLFVIPTCYVERWLKGTATKPQ